MDLKDRFLKYVSFDTQSDEMSETFPSTEKQKVLLKYLVEEMKSLGLTEVEMDEHSYAMGTIPATPGYEDRPAIGFIAHVDTSPDMSGANIKPQIIENYDGKDIRLNENLMMTVKDFPELSAFKGHTLITTDGTTLLGADDKAGVDYFNVEKFGAKFAYTIDGGFEGELEYENFNAASAKVAIQGRNVHPGYAKDKMINALQVAAEVNSLLPAWERPEHTDGYEGFYHLVGLNGSVENAEISYIIRDHIRDKFEAKKQFMTKVVELLTQKYGEGVLALTLKDQYYNMREMVEPHPEVIDKAFKAMEQAGVTPIVRPIRGGTDGARLSYMGLPCPNLFTGGMNFHGKFEYCSLDTMRRAQQTILNLIQLWAE